MTDGPSQDRPAEKDEIKPFHAKEASGQETADVLSAVIKHAAERDVAAKKKTPPKPQPVWMLPMGLTTSVLAAFLIVAPPPWIEMNPIAPPASEEALTDVRGAIFFNGSRIEGFRQRNGRLPETLAEAGVTVEGLDYTLRGAEDYMLIARVGERDIVFDSSRESLVDWSQREAGNLAQAIPR